MSDIHSLGYIVCCCDKAPAESDPVHSVGDSFTHMAQPPAQIGEVLESNRVGLPLHFDAVQPNGGMVRLSSCWSDCSESTVAMESQAAAVSGEAEAGQSIFKLYLQSTLCAGGELDRQVRCLVSTPITSDPCPYITLLYFFAMLCH